MPAPPQVLDTQPLSEQDAPAEARQGFLFKISAAIVFDFANDTNMRELVGHQESSLELMVPA